MHKTILLILMIICWCFYSKVFAQYIPGYSHYRQVKRTVNYYSKERRQSDAKKKGKESERRKNLTDDFDDYDTKQSSDATNNSSSKNNTINNPTNNNTHQNDKNSNDNNEYIIRLSTSLSDAQVNDSIMTFMKRKFPTTICNSCMSRTVSNQPRTRRVEKYDLYGYSYYIDEHYTEVVVTVQNKCPKNVRVLGISKGSIKGDYREYGLIWTVYEANEKQQFSRDSDDMVGSVLGNMFMGSIFGGGETRDIDLSHVGKKYDNNNAAQGSYQYLRIVEESTVSKTGISKSGTKTVEVTSYKKSTTINVKKGDKIYLRASGSIATGAWSGASGPNGKVYSNIWNIMPNYNYGALLMKIGTANWQLIGEEATIIAQNTGVLSFAVNDTDPSDNSGKYTVEYSINKPLP